jgi:hypothetical protein
MTDIHLDSNAVILQKLSAIIALSFGLRPNGIDATDKPDTKQDECNVVIDTGTSIMITTAGFAKHFNKHRDMNSCHITLWKCKCFNSLQF